MIRILKSYPFVRFVETHNINQLEKETMRYFNMFYEEYKNNEFFNSYATKLNFIILKSYLNLQLSESQKNTILRIVQPDNTQYSISNLKEFFNNLDIPMEVQPLFISTPLTPFDETLNKPYQSYLTKENTKAQIRENFNLIQEKLDNMNYTNIIYVKFDVIKYKVKEYEKDKQS